MPINLGARSLRAHELNHRHIGMAFSVQLEDVVTHGRIAVITEAGTVNITLDGAVNDGESTVLELNPDTMIFCTFGDNGQPPG